MLLPGSPLPLKADSLQTTMTSSFSFFDRIAAENEELEAREAAMQTQEAELNARLLAAAQRERLAKLEAEGAAAALHRAAEQKRAEEEARELGPCCHHGTFNSLLLFSRDSGEWMGP